MVILTFIKSLSYVGAVNLLLQEGYIEERTIEVSDSKCEKSLFTLIHCTVRKET